MPTSFEASTPVQMAPEAGQPQLPFDYKDVAAYVSSWRRQLHTSRDIKRRIWDECWALYRGVEDFSDKEDWQSKIVLPKAFASVKQAASAIRRLYLASGRPWRYEPINPEAIALQRRAEVKTDLVRAFWDKAGVTREAFESVESSLIIGPAIVKLWWGYEPKLAIEVGPQGEVARTERLEGRLFARAVDPYNFYWLPGSQFNRWTGTIEELEVPIWEVEQIIQAIQQAGLGDLLNPEAIQALQPHRIDEFDRQSRLRHAEVNSSAQSAPSRASGLVKLTEYYGPLFVKDQLVSKRGHVIMINDHVLITKENVYWHGKAPYVAWSPLAVPFRTDGVGLIEPVRQVLRNLSKITNMATDTINYSLMPTFEIFEDAYENPEDFETGLNPGKFFRRKRDSFTLPGITPVPFNDVSAGAVQVAAHLDRAFQEGALVSEIQQALPRFRGVQTASEIQIKQENQQSFFGSLATDMEQNFIHPLVDMAGDLVMQFVDTTRDPRVYSILGVEDAQVFAGMQLPDILQQIQGDFEIRVTGISEQIEKAEMLNNLVQFMNILGQNAPAWLPYIDQTELLRRIVEAFRPAIHDVDKIVLPPELVQAALQQQELRELTPELLSLQPRIIQQAAQIILQQQQMQLERERMEREAQQADADRAAARKEPTDAS